MAGPGRPLQSIKPIPQSLAMDVDSDTDHHATTGLSSKARKRTHIVISDDDSDADTPSRNASTPTPQESSSLCTTPDHPAPTRPRTVQQKLWLTGSKPVVDLTNQGPPPKNFSIFGSSEKASSGVSHPKPIATPKQRPAQRPTPQATIFDSTPSTFTSHKPPPPPAVTPSSKTPTKLFGIFQPRSASSSKTKPSPAQPPLTKKPRKSNAADDDDDADFVLKDSEPSGDEASVVDEEDFVVDDSDSDVAPSKSKKSKTSTAGKGPKLSVSGQKWTPSFRKNRKPRRIEHCPTESQAAELARESDRKGKAKLWPPLSDLGQIYADIVDRMPEALLKPLAETLQGQGRALRVATMCSGTESPLLALEMISRAVETKWGIKMGIEHVFSCELEPFKQAYIERNFKPPLLFRDVTELGNAKAHTAYGALVDVPGNIDLLVAGTSCVDYSGLNNKKKAMDEGGESGRTFFGMLEWVKRHQPAIVILENVKSAPWEGVGKFFEDANYDSSFSTRFDTKNYYIPHTRQRGYFFASRNTQGDYPSNWHNLVSSLQRPASSPIEAFMLPNSDQRIQTARAKLGFEQAGKSRSTIDWSKCQGRHEEARGLEKLGQARPFTSWEEGGSCLMSHGAWNEFARPQPERVLDLMDITVLRDAKRGEDPHFKSRIWELSQNVDRNIVAPQPGITGCLTPSGMPFLTSRGGPVTGLEALSLQGLPIDELLLTRESDDQLQNLAGNAMSSTVVGICCLSALVLARPDLEQARKESTNRTSTIEAVSKRHRQAVSVTGGDILAANQEPYDLVSLATVDMPSLLSRAVNSSQLCICEGAAGSKTDIYRCTSCDHTVCGSCKSRPTHELQLDENAQNGLRESPRAFGDYLKSALPMRLQLSMKDSPLLGSLRQAAEHVQGMEGRDAKRWTDRVANVLERAEYRFSHLQRLRVWTVKYHSFASRLELVLDRDNPHWSIYVSAEAAEPEGSGLRDLFDQPVARLRLDPERPGCTLLSAAKTGAWEINLPSRLKFKASVTSCGEQIDSWEAALGLRGDFEGTKRYSQMQVEIADDNAKAALQADDVEGLYDCLPNCGQANGSLHRRRGDGTSPLFLFVDAARYGSAKDDEFVFSRELGLPAYPEQRQIICSLAKGWKPERAPRDPTAGDDIEMTADEHERLKEKYKRNCEAHSSKKQHVEVTLCGQWRPLRDLSLEPYAPRAAGESVIAVPKAPARLDLDQNGCEEALAVLTCAAPLTKHALDSIWPSKAGQWSEVDLEHHASRTFAMLAWLMERVPEVHAWKDWMKADLKMTDESSSCCSVCAPAAPSIQWLKRGTKPPIPIENEREAGPYEQALKNRPFPFVLHLRKDGDSMAGVRIAVNVATLMHRALSRLPRQGRQGDRELTWRLKRIDPALTQFNLPEYRLSSNRHDPEAPTPGIFTLPLRKEQKRSLAWMLKQESEQVEPFIEEEVSEATLPALEWCAEGRARQNKVVRGGVIADAVGYGKTCISIALIAAQKAKEDALSQEPEPADPKLIETKATLVIVPPQLCKQWQNEVRKFVRKGLSVHVIFSKADLNNTTIEQMRSVDIVIMSVSVYKSDAYFDSLAAFAAANPIPTKEGRFFDSALSKSIAALPKRIKELQVSDKGKTLWNSIRERSDFDPSHLTTYKARKRIVGAQYAREKALQDDDGGAEDAVTVEDAWEQIKKEKISDVWGLKSGLKRWTDMSAAPLEAFSWRRIIIDEFHYIAADAGRVFSAVRSLTARSTWVLSGTPKTGDFADVRSMAAFLNIHLGIEDDADYADTSTRGRTSRNQSRSDVERFRNFVEVRSPAWHHRRQALAQGFLDRFVRQNIAEIDEIASVDVLKPVRMPAAERACYLELQHTIEALDLRHARTLFRGPARAKASISENDRDQRLRITLGESASPEEALSRQAAHFVLSATEKAQNAIEACDYIVNERAEQLRKCQEELREKLQAAKEQHFIVLLHYGYRDESKQALVSFAKNAIHAKYGDKESKQAVAAILEDAKCLEADLTPSRGRQLYPKDELKAALRRRAAAVAVEEFRKEAAAGAKKKQKKGGAGGKRKKAVDSDEEEEEEDSSDDGKVDSAGEKKAIAQAIKDVDAELSRSKKVDDDERRRLAWVQETRIRALVHHLVQLRNETAARQRSLRYFENIRTIQLSKGRGHSGECPGCKKSLTMATLSLSSVCGHVFCETCGRQEAWKGKCPEPGCNADAKPSSIVLASSLGVENEQVSAFGEKMSQLAYLLRDSSLIPSDDKVILFVQFEGLLRKTAHALHSYGIKFTRVRGSAKQRSQTLDDYQSGISPRVLLLDIADESAAGSNLTIANHVIFLSSLVTDDQATYRSTLQQARGRCLRFGQTKEVHVWQFLARATIDEEVFNKRECVGSSSSAGAATASLESVLEARSDRQKILGRQIDVQREAERAAARQKRSGQGEGGGGRGGGGGGDENDGKRKKQKQAVVYELDSDDE